MGFQENAQQGLEAILKAFDDDTPVLLQVVLVQIKRKLFIYNRIHQYNETQWS